MNKEILENLYFVIFTNDNIDICMMKINRYLRFKVHDHILWHDGKDYILKYMTNNWSKSKIIKFNKIRILRKYKIKRLYDRQDN